MVLMAAAAIIGAVGSIYQGVSAKNAADAVAGNMQYQGDLIAAEAFRTASIIEEEGQRFGAQQSLQYIGSGVEVAGSALVTIAQTKKYASTEAEATRARGEAQRNLAYSEAGIKRNEGRATMISGILQGVSKFAKVGVKGGTTEPVGESEQTISVSKEYNAPDYYYPGYDTPGSMAWYGGPRATIDPTYGRAQLQF